MIVLTSKEALEKTQILKTHLSPGVVARAVLLALWKLEAGGLPAEAQLGQFSLLAIPYLKI